MANPIMKAMEQSYVLEGEPMSINGSINKTLMLLLCVVVSACYTWQLVAKGFTDMASILMVGGLIVGFILSMIIIFARKALPILTPIYALAEGLALGGISAVYAAQYSGIVMQAIIATFVVLFSMLLLFKAKMIQCTEKFRAVLFTATMSIAIIYAIQIIASLFGRGIPQIFTASNLGIGFSIVVVLIAAFNLIIDFDFIERGAENMLPKEYEWYGAFGLMVSLIWLYLEILRLLAKVNSRK